MSLCANGMGLNTGSFWYNETFQCSQYVWSMVGGYDKKLRNFVLLGAGITVWSLWLHRNEIIFEKKNIFSPLQVIYSISQWIRTWGGTTKGGIPNYCGGGLAVLGADGQGFLIPGSWVAV